MFMRFTTENNVVNVSKVASLNQNCSKGSALAPDTKSNWRFIGVLRYPLDVRMIGRKWSKKFSRLALNRVWI